MDRNDCIETVIRQVWMILPDPVVSKETSPLYAFLSYMLHESRPYGSTKKTRPHLQYVLLLKSLFKALGYPDLPPKAKKLRFPTQCTGALQRILTDFRNSRHNQNPILVPDYMPDMLMFEHLLYGGGFYDYRYLHQLLGPSLPYDNKHFSVSHLKVLFSNITARHTPASVDALFKPNQPVLMQPSVVDSSQLSLDYPYGYQISISNTLDDYLTKLVVAHGAPMFKRRIALDLLRFGMTGHVPAPNDYNRGKATGSVLSLPVSEADMQEIERRADAYGVKSSVMARHLLHMGWLRCGLNGCAWPPASGTVAKLNLHPVVLASVTTPNNFNISFK